MSTSGLKEGFKRRTLGRIILIIDGLNENDFVGPTTYPPPKKRVPLQLYTGAATYVEA
jgi:hypothetical protein